MKLLSQSFGVMFALIYTFPKSMVIRPFCLASTAPSRILSSNTAPSEIKKRSSFQPKVAVIGSGNFGSVIAKVVGENLQRLDNDTEVKMWVFEEDIDGEKLTKVINSRHENVKYLPGIRLPKNVRACPDLSETCRDANVLLFVAPHQFLPSILRQLRGKVSPSTTCLSLIKGVETEGKELKRYTEMIQEALGVENCGAMMGANVAMDIARQDCVESTLAMTDLNLARDLATLFASDHFFIQVADDVHTVELCGALKNVVALGAGICDGLGLGCSSKAAVLRRGIEEIALFCQLTDKTGRFKVRFMTCNHRHVFNNFYGNTEGHNVSILWCWRHHCYLHGRPQSIGRRSLRTASFRRKAIQSFRYRGRSIYVP